MTSRQKAKQQIADDLQQYHHDTIHDYIDDIGMSWFDDLFQDWDNYDYDYYYEGEDDYV